MNQANLINLMGFNDPDCSSGDGFLDTKLRTKDNKEDQPLNLSCSSFNLRHSEGNFSSKSLQKSLDKGQALDLSKCKRLDVNEKVCQAFGQFVETSKSYSNGDIKSGYFNPTLSSSSSSLPYLSKSKFNKL